jgi:hypothetical protein
MHIEEVRQIACQHQINPEGLTHVELIRAIQGHEGNFNCYGTSYVVDCGQHECRWRTDCQIPVQSNSI